MKGWYLNLSNNLNKIPKTMFDHDYVLWQSYNLGGLNKSLVCIQARSVYFFI